MNHQDTGANPMELFQKWFHHLDSNYPQLEANAMTLSTIGFDGFPKNRIVLLKRFTWEGFIFFTNYNSDKGVAIADNNKVTLSFNWLIANMEVYINGKAEKISQNISEGYFENRPRGSKLGAWASNQSEVIPSRNILDKKIKRYESLFENKEIPKPHHWGGYIVKPTAFTFKKSDPSTGIIKVSNYYMDFDYIWSEKIVFKRDQ